MRRQMRCFAWSLRRLARPPRISMTNSVHPSK
jgi:hypothetical protein